jgi:hypothetical protein
MLTFYYLYVLTIYNIFKTYLKAICILYTLFNNYFNCINGTYFNYVFNMLLLFFNFF